jgi:CRISPR system Cascade subunit CasB
VNDPMPVTATGAARPNPTETATPERPRPRLVAALRHALEAADPGTLAALRRTDPASPPAAFYRITVSLLDEHLPEAGPRRLAEEGRWAVVVAAMANAVGFMKKVPLGEALAKAGVAEMRVVRLLEARDSQLADLVRNIVHQLVQKAQSFDPNDLADLVLSDSDEPRRWIARSFYRHQGA